MSDSNPYSIDQPKIDPGRRMATRPDGSPDDNDRIETGPTELAFDEWAAMGVEAPNLDQLRAYRLERVRQELRRRDYAGVLLWDPLNIRYTTDTINMQLWIAHNAARCCLVLADGPVVMFEYAQAVHLADYLPLVDEVRKATVFFYFASGDRAPEFAADFAGQVNDLLRQYGGGNRRLAVDKMEIAGVRAFDRAGISIQDGQQLMEHARKIKDANEMKAMRCAVATCEIAMAWMEEEVKPGLTENDLWAVLHAENIRRGGEWIETRLLSSGPRTNPWFQECGPRVIRDGDIIAFDTDLIGPYGYCCDISRTWICGDHRPSNEQRSAYQEAKDHIDANTELLKPGLSFRELSESSHMLSERYREQAYGVLAHGVGLCDEYPSIKYPWLYEQSGYDGVFEPGMVMCMEAYVGAKGGDFGIKLEEQVLITETGTEKISSYPFDKAFLD